MPDTLARVAALNERLAARKSVRHSLTFAWFKNRLVSTFTTGHWLIVVVLGQWVGKSVTDED